MYSTVKFIATESRMAVARAWRKERMGSHRLMGTVSVLQDEESSGDGNDGCTTSRMYLIPLNCTFKNG